MRPARDAVGLGLRPEFLAGLRDSPVASSVEFLEVIAENHAVAGSMAEQNLAAVRQGRPVVAHAVSLNLGGSEPIDVAQLSRLRALVERHDAPWLTDHLSWSGSGGLRHHDLLPVPCHGELVDWVAHRIRTVTAAVDVPVGIENISSYFRWRRDDMAEWEFLSLVLEAADCGLLLDLNNLHVSSRNQGQDPFDLLDAVPWGRVMYVHLAGHTRRIDGLLHDTHDSAVDESVWSLYREAWRRGGPFPTLLEWDDRIPPLETAVRELDRARKVRR